MTKRKGLPLAEAMIVYGDPAEVETWRNAKGVMKEIARFELVKTLRKRWIDREVSVQGFWNRSPVRLADISPVFVAERCAINVDTDTARDNRGNIAFALRVLPVPEPPMPELPRPQPWPEKKILASPRRGPRPEKTRAAAEVLRKDIRRGAMTPAALAALPQRALAQRMGVGRSTACEARKIVMPELGRSLFGSLVGVWLSFRDSPRAKTKGF